MSFALDRIDALQQELTNLSDRIWGYAETSLKEFQSADDLASFLHDHGFTVVRDIAGLETAFTASWGSGEPKLGFLAEYDALPGLHNEAQPVQSVENADLPGHGCGHNLLGVACVAAVLGLKAEMEAKQLSGTIIFYGCPAEENYSAKVPMAAAGAFDGLSAAFAFHPSGLHNVSLTSSVANNSIKFSFKGRTAHAGGDPFNGRSALDAVEIMNVGANYLREHVISDARIHYIITEGGKAPNIVPERAQVWYFVRAPKVHQLNDIVERLKKVARGAAMMTETEVDIVLESGVCNYIPNEILANVVYESMQELPPIAWTPDEIAFAETMVAPIPEAQKQASRERQMARGIAPDSVLWSETIAPQGKGLVMTGSTDVSDVSWQVPTVMFGTPCYPWLAPGHSWMITACSGHSIGHKGMLLAGKAMALASLKLIADADLRQKAMDEFQAAVAGLQYKPYGEVPLPKFDRPQGLK